MSQTIFFPWQRHILVRKTTWKVRFENRIISDINGTAYGTTYIRKGVSYIFSFQKSLTWDCSALRKTKIDVIDTGPMSDFPEDWTVTVDKGYQGSQTYICAINPTKTPKEKTLRSTEKGKWQDDKW